ncbi:WD40 repeat domain-containing protein [Tumebacillus lipolyticus]|uniref:WD40 repeat domain-containing protein n=1 Tax=Tumebacillus lipolyticus TaxID=1280370 RepID=A0ABW4ZVC3_9BACL
MHIPNRLLRVVYAESQNVLIASDVRGRIHKFDLALNLLQSSPAVTYDRPVNSLCLSDKYVFTKDRAGAIGKWDLATLQPLDFYDEVMICDRRDLFEDEEPSPSPNRGIAYLNGKVYTNNGYTQIVVLDAETFEVIDIRTSPSPTFFDCICVGNPELHALSDVEGKLYIGNLETNEFPVQAQVDTNVVHGVVYDARHDRFWTTQDGGLGEDKLVRTGVTTIEKDGTGFQEYKISHEDNEFIQFDQDCRNLFVGGFNGKIFIFDNETKEFRLKRVIGPLDFQIIHAAIVSEDQIYALLQTGDLIQLDRRGVEVNRALFHNRCVWILEPHPDDESLLYAGTDEGVHLIRYGPGRFDTVHLEQLEKHVHGFGITKDVKPLPDGSYVGISRSGIAFQAERDGTIRWYRQVLGVPRGVALSAEYDRCMVATDEGTVWEFCTEDGSVLDRIPVGSPVYACAYALDGRRIVTADQHQMVHVYPPDSHERLGSIQFTLRLKRMMRGSAGEIYVTGGDGMVELDLENYAIKKQFVKYLTNTKENGVYCEGHMYVGGYGYQVGTYRYEDGEMVDLQEYLPDFSKAFAARVPEDGIPILLVGGRSGYINAYRIYDGIPFKVREYYIR